ncbi:hypothetical protein SDC9_188410 [bioreactor metagenome]|uniref:Uncharacterized protein n=1 Tax=bioreactor metagenome TaxID=1076179 RepID=A0A645HPU8_9ZZZZ
MLELVGKATNTPYWRCIPGGKPDPVVVENMRRAYEALSPELKLGLVQVTLRKYGEPVQITQTLDEDTQRALQKVYSERYASLGELDVMTWKGFEPLFFGVPMAWDGQLAEMTPPPAARMPQEGVPTTTANDRVGS